MSLFDRLFAGERLPRLPETARIADLDALHVRTAGDWVVVSCDLSGARALIDACQARDPLQLRGPGRSATFVPVKRLQKIVLDPNQGWIIPLTPEAVTELAALEPVAGEHVFGQLGVVFEPMD